MQIELWAFGDNLHFGLPQRTGGLILLSLELAAILLAVLHLLRTAKKQRRGSSYNGLRFLAFLLLLAPIGAEIFVVRLNGLAGLPSPMVPSMPRGWGISIVGTLCWMLADGWLGTPEALAVALAFGLVRGGWQTHSALEPLHTILQATAFAALLRLEWEGLLWRWLRHPVIAGVLSGILSGSLHAADLCGRSLGTPFEAALFALSWLPAALTAAALEGGVAATAAGVFRSTLRIPWNGPQGLRPSPFGSQRIERLLAWLAVITVAVMGGFVFSEVHEVRAAIKDERATRMKPLAEDTKEALRLFVQTARVLISQQAADVGSNLPADPSASGEVPIPTSMPFFDGLAAVDGNGDILLEQPSGWITGRYDPSEIQYRWALALTGIPGELFSPPGGFGEGASMVFFSPILQPGLEKPVGGMAGRANLSANPILLPLRHRFDTLAQEEVYVTDLDGMILWASDDSRISATMNDSRQGSWGGTRVAADGTLHLVHAEDLEGYSWRVVVTMPLEAAVGGPDSLVTRGLLAMASVSAAGALLMLVFRRRQSLQLQRVADEIAAIAEGGDEGRFRPRRLDDVTDLLPLIRDLQAGMERRRQDLDVGLDIDRRIASGGDLPDLLPGILERLRSAMKADLVRLVLAPEVGQILGLPPFLQAGSDPGQWHVLDRQILALCSKSGQLILENPSRAKPILDTGNLSLPVQALLAQSLQVGAASEGVVWFGYRTPRAIDPSEVVQLTGFLERVSGLVAKAYWYRRAEMERSQAMLILDSFPDPVFFTTTTGDVIYANPPGGTLLKETRPQPGGEGEPGQGLREAFMTLGSALASSGRKGIRSTDGRIFRPQILEVGPKVGRIGHRLYILRDVSEQDFDDRLRSSLVAMMGQEARASLEQLLAYGRMLSAVGAMSEQQRELIRKAQDSGQVLDHLLKDLFLIGGSPIRSLPLLESIELGSLLGEILAAHSPQARNRQVRVVLDQPEPSPTVQGSRLLVRQALSTLVKNAILSTPGGGVVTLTARLIGPHVQISVADTGHGIAPADLQRILERGALDTSEDRKDDGIGAGIRMAREIVTRHGGTLTADSRLGAGTTIVLQLPVHQN